MPENAEAGAGNRPRRRLLPLAGQVVLAVAEEQEMAGRQPGQQLAGLRLLRVADVGEPGDQFAGGRPHPPLVLHGDPQVIQHPAQVRGELDGIAGVGQLHVDPGLLDRAGGRLGADVRLHGPVRDACHVPLHGEQRMDDQPDVGQVPVELHRHRVDQVGHVIGDDVDDRASAGQRGLAGLAGRDGRAALRAAGAERRVPGRDRRHALRPGRGEVLCLRQPVVRGEEAGQVAHGPAGVTRRGYLAVPGRPQRRRFGEHCLPGVVREFRHCLSTLL